jgi:hypothetical protein
LRRTARRDRQLGDKAEQRRAEVRY